MKRLILLTLLVLPMMADTQQPFDTTSIGVHIGYDGNQSRHAVPSADFTRKMGKIGAVVAGFQAFSYSAFEVTGVARNPLQLQVSAVTGMALIKPLGEYVYTGPLGALGVANDGTNTGMAGKVGYVLGYRFGKSQHWSIEAVGAGDKTTLSKLTPVVFLGVRYGWGR